jgi:hypothetical protein
MIVSKTTSFPTPRSILATPATGAAVAVVLAHLGGKANSAQDKYTVQVPKGLAFSDFRGYENWEEVAVSETETGIKVIVANPTMMAAYRDGLAADGEQFPPHGNDAKCGYECHSRVSAQDYIFTAYPKW